MKPIPFDRTCYLEKTAALSFMCNPQLLHINISDIFFICSAQFYVFDVIFEVFIIFVDTNILFTRTVRLRAHPTRVLIDGVVHAQDIVSGEWVRPRMNDVRILEMISPGNSGIE